MIGSTVVFHKCDYYGNAINHTEKEGIIVDSILITDPHNTNVNVTAYIG